MEGVVLKIPFKEGSSDYRDLGSELEHSDVTKCFLTGGTFSYF